MSAPTFRTAEPHLSHVLDEVARGKIQLPDFQRGWVWDDNHIRSLIASVTLSYPVGAVMLMETGGESVRFKPRVVEGADLPNPPQPEKLILDGQQRLTSLFLALKSGRLVPTRTDKGVETDRWYYLDMARCLNPEVDREEAIVSVKCEKTVTADFGRDLQLDLRTPEGEYQANMFPLRIVFDLAQTSAWENGYRKYFNYDAERLQFLDHFRTTVLVGFHQYKIPVIELLRETPKDAVCKVFEKVNTGGVSLSVFELVTAAYAAEDFSLRDDWQAREKRLTAKQTPVRAIDATDFLTAATLLSTYQASLDTGAAVGCKRKDILDKLSLELYRSSADKLEKGFLDAGRFMVREKVFDERNLPYKTQLVPLAVLCTVLGNRFEDEGVKAKLARWYWCGVFGEMYGGSTEARFAFDVPEVLNWLDGGPEPRTIRDSNFASLRLLSLQTRQSAAYKGLAALLMRKGCCDFLNGEQIELASYFEAAIDIHHIFPKHYCEVKKFQSRLWNSVINKAPLSARTNRIIGGRAPSLYLQSLLKNNKVERPQVDKHLRSHLIEPSFLWNDDFEGFLHHRACQLLNTIEAATAKKVTGRDDDEVVREFGAPLDPDRLS